MFHAFILAASIVAAPDAAGASLVNVIRGELVQLRTGELTIPVHGSNTRFAIPAEMRSKALELVGRRVVLECEYMADRRWWVTSIEPAKALEATPAAAFSPVLVPPAPLPEAPANTPPAPPGPIAPKE